MQTSRRFGDRERRIGPKGRPRASPVPMLVPLRVRVPCRNMWRHRALGWRVWRVWGGRGIGAESFSLLESLVEAMMLASKCSPAAMAGMGA